MVLRLETWKEYESCCNEGHSSSATKASVESALRAAYDLDAGEITVAVLGRYVVLEGFVRRKGDEDRAAEIAEDIVGKGYVKSRLLRR
ncbi:BON domain-containing protein [Rhizobium sullae]|uniref:BON domain-containing protein n=1 Tax=Rhizobium sullae TaxID=50338 RepID=A0A2N0D4G1_RHISU|nr:BON domain-containing protein [Rhizobium sullae]PKA40995.1 BON domain-containing protein [Rhizobium sullae]UWU14652.1 BON domain-containing protein [Rhizobium sullae]